MSEPGRYWVRGRRRANHGGNKSGGGGERGRLGVSQEKEANKPGRE